MKKTVQRGSLQLCDLCYTHGITGARPQERDWPTERGVETTRVFKTGATGASFVTDNRNNKN